MYLSIIEVEPVRDYILLLTFENGERRTLDMKPYMHSGIFAELQDFALFNSVRVSFDTIEWANEADLDPEFLYEESKPA